MRKAFVRLVDLALEREVSFVLLAGDLSDQGWKDANTALFLKRQVARLTSEGIEVFVVWGNHDLKGAVAKLWRTSESVHVFPSNKAATVPLAGLPVAVHGRSLSQNIRHHNLAKTFPQPVEGFFNIGLLHTSLDGREGHDDYAPCSREDLLSKRYDYWALGHVHDHEVVQEDPWVIFPGCIQGRHVRETGPKGCLVVEADLDAGRVAGPEFVALDQVRWEVASLDVTGMETENALWNEVGRKLEDLASRAEGRPLAVRFILEGRSPLAGPFVANPFALEEHFRSLAAEAAAGQVFVESVRLDSVSTGVDAEDALPAGLFEEVVGRIRDMAEELESIRALDAGDKIGGVGKTLDGLVARMVRSHLKTLVPDEAELRQLLGEANEMVLARLFSAAGGTEGDPESSEGRGRP